jgi:3-oxoacyl-[acyl-carrier protein] reductase
MNDTNVSASKDARRMLDAAETAFGGIDLLVNNAGIMLLSSTVDTDDASFERQVGVNLKGTFNTLREAATGIRNGGRIINFSSSVVGLLQPTYGVYAATKAAVEAMTSILAKELRGRAITVNAVAPGPTATDLFLRGKPHEVRRRRSGALPGAPRRKPGGKGGDHQRGAAADGKDGGQSGRAAQGDI